MARRPFVQPISRTVTPPSLRTRLSYNVQYRMNQGALLSPNTAIFQFCGNSVFNPDLNVTLERYPIGVPQYSNLYQRYHVHASRITVNAQPEGGITTAESNWLIFAHPYTSALPLGAVTSSDYRGQPFSSEMFTAGPISNVVRRSMRFNSAAVFSRPVSQIWCSETTSGYLVSTLFQPASQWFWGVVFTNSTATASLPLISANFTIEYDVVLYQVANVDPITHDTTGAFVESPPDVHVCVDDEMKDEPSAKPDQLFHRL